MEEKKSTRVVGLVKNISDITTTLRDNKKPITKSVLSIETTDNQTLYIEVRKKALLQKIEKSKVMIGDYITLGFTFRSSETESGRFNNLIANYISFVPE
jgi:hypothetical protein